MFFEAERLPTVQKMILADTVEERQEALDVLLPYQREDFRGLFEAMSGMPVIIRLIDPPLHEFLPSAEELKAELATATDGAEVARIEKTLARLSELHEENPMLGFRGVRLGILMPEISRMQARAIIEAACDAAENGFKPMPEAMIPVSIHVNEIERLKKLIVEVAEEVMAARGVKVDYKVGTMVETPRAAITADQLATEAEFFSFGTNDLTQTTFAISRDDAEKSFLIEYVEQGVLPVNPFQTLDRDGVGALIKIAVEGGRKTRPGMEIGICGEHGGDPESVHLCHELGLDYVSCSPFRVPVARLAAAQAALADAG
jgi:pyruvate,orthophosphate dikinase